MKIKLLIKNACIITMDSERRILTQSAIAVNGDTIVAIGKTAEVEARYTAERVIDARGKLIFPGLISTHTHLFQTLLKGLGKDKPLFEWLNSSIRPLLHRYTKEAMYYAALIGLIEAVRTGTTTVTDYQYCHSDKGFDLPVIEAFEKLGMRGVLSKAHTDVSGFPKEIACLFRETEEDYFRDLEVLCREYAGHPLISMSLAPGIIWDHSREGYRRTREIADKYHIPITMHVVETIDDDEYALKTWNKRTIPFLEECGVLGPDFIAVHSVHLTEEDIRIFKKHQVSVAHCPIPNMLLASGSAPVPRLLEEGITVSLACDGAASNDAQDMLEVLKITALKHKLVSGNAAVVSAAEVLEMATLGGAKALLQEDRIGSLEAGKKADMFIYNPLDCRSIPLHDPVSALVYNSSRANIETSIIGGKVILDHGVIPGIDEEAILFRAQEISLDLVQQSGLGSIQWNQDMRSIGKEILTGKGMNHV